MVVAARKAAENEVLRLRVAMEAERALDGCGRARAVGRGGAENRGSGKLSGWRRNRRLMTTDICSLPGTKSRPHGPLDERKTAFQRLFSSVLFSGINARWI